MAPCTCCPGSVFWPAVNVANFMWCPPKYRVLYVNVCGLFWNTYLSWVNSGAQAAAAPSKTGSYHKAFVAGDCERREG